MWYSPTTVSFSSPEEVCPLCCVSVCLLFLAPDAKCLIRNPDDSSLHLQIEFLYRLASGIHFPTGFNQYSLTQLKFGETNKNADWYWLGVSKHLLHKGCLWWRPIKLTHGLLVESGPELYPGPKAVIVLFCLILWSRRPERLLQKQHGVRERWVVIYQVTLRTCCWASLSGWNILRFHVSITE